MARNVYFDPFGQRTEGYRAGVQDEQSLQGATRAARQIDWNYANMNPIDLQTAQRANAFGAYADPYARAAVDRNDYAAELPLRLDFGLRTGTVAPAQNLDYMRYQPSMVLGGQNGNPDQMFYRGPGGMQRAQWNPQSYLDYASIVNPAAYGASKDAAAMEQFYRQNQADYMKSAAYNQAILWQQLLGAGAGGSGAGAGGGGMEGYTGGYYPNYGPAPGYLPPSGQYPQPGYAPPPGYDPAQFGIPQAAPQGAPEGSQQPNVLPGMDSGY